MITHAALRTAAADASVLAFIQLFGSLNNLHTAPPCIHFAIEQELDAEPLRADAAAVMVSEAAPASAAGVLACLVHPAPSIGDCIVVSDTPSLALQHESSSRKAPDCMREQMAGTSDQPLHGVPTPNAEAWTGAAAPASASPPYMMQQCSLPQQQPTVVESRIVGMMSSSSSGERSPSCTPSSESMSHSNHVPAKQVCMRCKHVP